MAWGPESAEDYRSATAVQEEEYRDIYIPQSRSGARKAGMHLDLARESRLPSVGWLPMVLWVFGIAVVIVVLLSNREFMNSVAHSLTALFRSSR